ncbi:uncharacterized protein PG986_014515 [Apiospora aurea]|uniref:Glycoside hydrolase family 5 protein n=1 Tax=Apiospora aurea TaxID=335848 RepID=A0ABR1PTH8_9PEZI
MVNSPFWLSILTSAALAALTPCANDSGNSWRGANLYYLQGLSDGDQDAYINAMATDGAKVVRVWVNRRTAGNCQKGSRIVSSVPPLETSLGVYNDATLDALDKVIVKLRTKEIKALISPHDANSLLGDYRRDVYFDKFGPAGFYQDQAAFDAYDARLSYILNYKGASSGNVWKEWSDAIMGFDLQVETFNSVGLPALYWQFLLPSVAQCPYTAAGDAGDHFGIVYDSGTDLAGPMRRARESEALQDWRPVI